MVFNRYKEWVPDNADEPTSPDNTPGVMPEDYGTSMMPDQMEAMNGGPTSGMKADDMDTSSMMPDRMGPLTKDS